jgi:hypothetical protein
MDFSLTTVFVVPSGNTIPTSGGTELLGANNAQFGIFKSDYLAATAGNVVNEPYIYLAQGRKEGVLPLTTKRSDKIGKLKIKDWYKVVAESDILPQVSEVSNFKVQCGEDVSVTFRLHANYIDAGFYNGMTRSVTVKTACCDCGGNPCTDIDPQATVDLIIAKAKEDVYLNKYLTFQRIGSGTSSILRVTGKTLDRYANACDVAAYPQEYDRLYFRVFVYTGTETTQDFFTDDKCDTVATVLVKQRASFLRGTSSEIKQLEINFFSYQSTYKHLFRQAGYNGAYESLVVDGTFYDTYVIKAEEIFDGAYTMREEHDFTVIIAVPTGAGSSIETVLVAYLGAVSNKSAADRTTTTTTSTTSTSTTSTTQLNP